MQFSKVQERVRGSQLSLMMFSVAYRTHNTTRGYGFGGTRMNDGCVYYLVW
ncbi:hypothetical protein MtrunA17_Chr2g0303531 [Medicago truncatula]|uniref:Uncharacterized protein n=1 Tax=Medicago truncatula TaxID=3880 RepID=A0A396JA29_MEDTR|nr:hypothetical protein MtrunA17_Chr2g0303531 [Medicago truncatula]